MLIEFEVHFECNKALFSLTIIIANTNPPKTMLTGYVASVFLAILGLLHAELSADRI